MDAREAILNVESVALEMEKSIDSLMITIAKGNTLTIELEERSDFPEILCELKEGVITARIQKKMDVLIRMLNA